MNVWVGVSGRGKKENVCVRVRQVGGELADAFTLRCVRPTNRLPYHSPYSAPPRRASASPRARAAAPRVAVPIQRPAAAVSAAISHAPARVVPPAPPSYSAPRRAVRSPHAPRIARPAECCLIAPAHETRCNAEMGEAGVREITIARDVHRVTHTHAHAHAQTDTDTHTHTHRHTDTHRQPHTHRHAHRQALY